MVALALTSLVAFGMVGCSPEEEVVNSSPAPAEDIIELAEYEHNGYVLQVGEVQIEDEKGEYSTIKLPTYPESDTDSATTYNLVGDADRYYNQQEVMLGGFSKANVGQALQDTYGLTFEAVLDGEISDKAVTDAEYVEWYERVITPKYNLREDLHEDLRYPGSKVFLTGVGSETAGTLPAMIRDGNQRYAFQADENSKPSSLRKLANVDRVYTHQIGEESHLVVELEVFFDLRASDESVRDLYVEGLGYNEEETKEDSVNDLYDNKGENLIPTEGMVQFVFSRTGPEGTLVITGGKVSLMMETNKDAE